MANAHAAFFDVAPACLGIDDSHAGQDIPPSRLLQEVTCVALRHALRSTSGRATRRTKYAGRLATVMSAAASALNSRFSQGQLACHRGQVALECYFHLVEP